MIAAHAEYRDGQEPGQHDRPEDAADKSRPAALHGKQTDQHHNGDRYDHRRQRGRVDLETFNGAQDRDRGRDCPVAIEQSCTEQAKHQHAGAPSPWPRVPCAQEREERHNAALAAIVGAHDEDRVLERDDEDQRPDNQRDNAEHRVRERSTAARRGLDGLLEGVKRARADIAVNNSKRAERCGGRQRRKAVGRFDGECG